jgi:hypothetical protein
VTLVRLHRAMLAGMACAAAAMGAEPVDRASSTRIALERAATAAASIDDPFRRIEAHADRAVAHGVAGDAERARDALRSAEAALEDVRVALLRDWALHGIALAQMRLADLTGASATLLAIADSSVRDSGYEALAARQARRGDYDAATATALLVRHPQSRAGALRDLVTVRAGKGNLAGALTSARSITDGALNALALTDVAAAHVRDRDVPGARSLAARIRDAELRARALGVVAVTQMEVGDVAGAEATAALIDDFRERELALVRMAGAQAAFDARTARQRLELAMPRLARVRARPEWRAVALRDAGEAWLAAGEKERARQALASASEAAGGVRGASLRNALLGPIARVQARAGAVDAALATAARLQVSATHALVVRDIASAAAQAGYDDDALRAAGVLADADARVAALLALLDVQVRSRRTESARRTFDAALAALRSAEPSALRAGALAALAVKGGKIGDTDSGPLLDEAFAAAGKIKASAERSAAHLAIAAALAD